MISAFEYETAMDPETGDSLSRSRIGLPTNGKSMREAMPVMMVAAGSGDWTSRRQTGPASGCRRRPGGQRQSRRAGIYRQLRGSHARKRHRIEEVTGRGYRRSTVKRRTPWDRTLRHSTPRRSTAHRYSPFPGRLRRSGNTGLNAAIARTSTLMPCGEARTLPRRSPWLPRNPSRSGKGNLQASLASAYGTVGRALAVLPRDDAAAKFERMDADHFPVRHQAVDPRAPLAHQFTALFRAQARIRLGWASRKINKWGRRMGA